MDSSSNSIVGDRDTDPSTIQSLAHISIGFIELYWMQVLTSTAIFILTYRWIRHLPQAPCTPSTVLVPSTSTYPSQAYTKRRKLPAIQFIDDFLAGRVELRDAQSGQGLVYMPTIVSFRFNADLAVRALYTMLRTSHSESGDRRNAERFILANDSLLEEILGPDRLPLVGYFRGGVPVNLEANLSIQMDRIANEYLELDPDDRLLDVNGQWGDLDVYLAHEYHTPICTILETHQQLAHATNMAGESQAQPFLRFIVGNYRDIPKSLPPGMPKFTKAIALDALDTVGSRHIRRFLRLVSDSLEINGCFLIQATTTPSNLGYSPYNSSNEDVQMHNAATQRRMQNDVEDSPIGTESHSVHSSTYVDSGAATSRPNAGGKGPVELANSSDDNIQIAGEQEWAEHWWYYWFKQYYIQQGADTASFISIEQLMSELQVAGFEVIRLESLTADAAQTTAIWASRLCISKRQIEAEMGESAFRLWELYLNWTQSLYARGRLHKHFVLAVKRT